jgi:hypothetical protein
MATVPSSADLEQLANLLEIANNICAELQKLRDSQSDEIWDAQLDSPFGDLLCYSLDLEHLLTK